MTIGERIKQRRLELGLTQTELAHRMGITSKTTICKAETTNFNPTTDRVREFAKALECTPGFLMGWEDAPLEESKPEPGDDKIAKAIELYSRYENLPPEMQKEFQDYLAFLQSKSARNQ